MIRTFRATLMRRHLRSELPSKERARFVHDIDNADPICAVRQDDPFTNMYDVVRVGAAIREL